MIKNILKSKRIDAKGLKQDGWGMKSCIGCKYLFSQGDGYSNYTWMDTIVDCALGLNSNLPSEKGDDWIKDSKKDNWHRTNTSRCESFKKLGKNDRMVELDVDGDNYPEDFTSNEEVIKSVYRRTDRKKKNSLIYNINLN